MNLSAKVKDRGASNTALSAEHERSVLQSVALRIVARVKDATSPFPPIAHVCTWGGALPTYGVFHLGQLKNRSSKTYFFDIVTTHNEHPSDVKHVLGHDYVFFTLFTYWVWGRQVLALTQQPLRGDFQVSLNGLHNSNLGAFGGPMGRVTWA